MIVGILSGKGGVGKTTVAINLATSITKLGDNPILVDGNFETPHVSIYLGQPDAEPNISYLIANEDLESSIVEHSSGIQLVAGDITNYAKKDGWALSRLRQTLESTERSIILDMPAGMDSEILSLVDKVIIVTTPDLVAVTDAYKTIKLCKAQDKKIIGIIVNKYSHDSMMDLESIETMLETNILGILPEEKLVNLSVKMRHPVVYSHPYSKISVAFNDIAKHLLGK